MKSDALGQDSIKAVLNSTLPETHQLLRDSVRRLRSAHSLSNPWLVRFKQTSSVTGSASF